jgi:flagellar hook assembly protein FlgD
MTSTATVISNISPTPTSNAFNEIVIQIYNESGEEVRSIIANTKLSQATSYNFEISAFVQSEHSNGGFVKIYLNNIFIANWNCLDSNGELVDNGVYQVELQTQLLNGEKLTMIKNVFVEPWQGNANIVFTARPNLSLNNSKILLNVSNSQNLSFSNFSIKIYDVTGELIKELNLGPSHEVIWDLKNIYDQQVASGLYLVVLTATNSDGTIITKVIKVAVIK